MQRHTQEISVHAQRSQPLLQEGHLVVLDENAFVALLAEVSFERFSSTLKNVLNETFFSKFFRYTCLVSQITRLFRVFVFLCQQ